MKRTEKTYTYSELITVIEKLKKSEKERTNNFIKNNPAYEHERRKDETIYNAALNNFLFVLL